MIAHCRTCHRAYWRYRRDHPPAGYCCVPHAETGPRKPADETPLEPAQVLVLLRTHLWQAHHTTSLYEWFPCRACEDLNALYADSLNYHSPPVAATEPGEPDPQRGNQNGYLDSKASG